MCGRINQDERSFQSDQRWHNKIQKQERQFNIGIGMKALVYHSLDGKENYEYLKFGFNAGGRYNFNARIEGFHNKNNQLDYNGPLGLATNPIYKHLVNYNRCVIPVSSFIEGPEVEKLSKPFDIRFAEVKVIGLGGLIGLDEKTGELGFSIITTWPNETIKNIVGHHRSPYIMFDPDDHGHWIDRQIPFDIISSAVRPPHDEFLAVHPLSPAYKSPKYSEPINV